MKYFLDAWPPHLSKPVIIYPFNGFNHYCCNLIDRQMTVKFHTKIGRILLSSPKGAVVYYREGGSENFDSRFQKNLTPPSRDDKKSSTPLRPFRPIPICMGMVAWMHKKNNWQRPSGHNIGCLTPGGFGGSSPAEIFYKKVAFRAENYYNPPSDDEKKTSTPPPSLILRPPHSR